MLSKPEACSERNWQEAEVFIQSNSYHADMRTDICQTDPFGALEPQKPPIDGLYMV